MIDTKQSYKAQAFWYAFFTALLVFLPFVIMDKGYFIYYGDFNVQQIPFYKLAHEAVRSGDVWWSWYTDLGANFIGSYSFYLLFSPFFWLTLPFPTSWLPFFMAPLLVLKMACCSLTAYLYLERFVRQRRWAVVGGLLYAFSGWMLFNIFFNHFLDVAVFFPLLLLGVEQLVTEDRKVFFALMVAVNAMVNYWFFAGEAVFVILYVLVRMRHKAWGMTPGKFARLSLEAVLGFLLVAVVVVPSVLALMGNPRTGADNFLTGWNFWLYWHEQRQPAILQSLLFPPELPARPNFFPDHDAKWASLSGWLPVVGLSGVLAYCFSRKNDWVKNLLALCLLFALVPGLNSLFVLLNHSYYARWFYMPVLVMCLASIRALEDLPRNAAFFERALKWVGIACLVFVAVSGLTPRFVDGALSFGMAAYPPLLWGYAAFTAVSLALCGAVALGMRKSGRHLPFVAGSVALFTVAFGIFYLACGRSNSERTDFVVNTALRGRDYISLPDEPFARVDVYDSMDNIAMFWHLPNVQAFHSIVPPSIMEFYPEINVTRDVGSRPGPEPYALRPLFSVRWLFINQNNVEQEPMPGYTKYTEMVGFNVYENDYYLPMGFGYTHYISRDDLEQVPKYQRGNLLLRAVVLEEDGIDRNSNAMERLDIDGVLDFSEASLAVDVQERRAQAAYGFSRDTRGFTSYTNLEEETLMFYSVPWERGWSASIDGAPAEIEKAHIGFMAVLVPAGEHEIRFDYFTPGLLEGAAVSGGALLALAVYLLAAGWGKKRASVPAAHPDSFDGQAGFLSWDEYLGRWQTRQARRAHLQHVLNEAARLHVREHIGEDEKTLRFIVDPSDDKTDA